ncbi:MAG: peptidylprolyl isomerase [Anaerolineae bacterium]|nr:peptidylprolyl isomerase [Anaerolineae bacterium]
MSKRQTTGMPKPRQAQVAAAEAAKREQKSRHEREAEIQRYIIIGTVVTVVVVGLILLASVIIDLLVVPNQTVATVNGTNISVAQFENRVRLERTLLNEQINNYIFLLQSMGQDPNQYAGQEPLRTWLSEVQIPDQLGNSVITDMITETLIRQEAAERNLSVTQEDIDREIGRLVGYDPDTAGLVPTATVTPTITPTPFVSPTPSPTLLPTATAEATGEATAEATAEVVNATPTWTPQPTPTATATRTAEEAAQAFSDTKSEYFSELGRLARLSEADIRAYFETIALRRKLADALSADVTTSIPHVDARHILVATEEEAQDVLAALQNGESFADLARAVSTDTGSGANGGELGWAPVTNFVDEFAAAVTDAPLGELIGPVETEFGWHIIQVRARENREITADELESYKDRKLTTFLEDLRTAEDGTIETFSVWTEHVPADPAFVLQQQ